MRIEPKLTEEHKNKGKKFVNWLGHHFRKEDTMRRRKNISSRRYVQFTKSTSNRDEADEKGGIKEKHKFPQIVMVWLGVCSKRVTPLVIFHRGNSRSSRKSFQLHLSREIRLLKNIGHLKRTVRIPITQKWYQDNFPSFIDKDHWSRFKSIGLLYLG